MAPIPDKSTKPATTQGMTINTMMLSPFRVTANGSQTSNREETSQSIKKYLDLEMLLPSSLAIMSSVILIQHHYYSLCYSSIIIIISFDIITFE